MKVKKYWFSVVLLVVFESLLLADGKIATWDTVFTPQEVVTVVDRNMRRFWRLPIFTELKDTAVVYEILRVQPITYPGQPERVLERIDNPTMEEAVKKEVEANLNEVGISILSLEKWQSSPSKTVLWVKTSIEEPQLKGETLFVSAQTVLVTKVVFAGNPEKNLYILVWGGGEGLRTRIEDVNSTAAKMVKKCMERLVYECYADKPNCAGENDKKACSYITKGRLLELDRALSIFNKDTGRYPTEEEGLHSLINKPKDAIGWRSCGYLNSTEILRDAWGNDFLYKTPGKNGALYVIISYGADGKPGGVDWDKDLESTDLYE